MKKILITIACLIYVFSPVDLIPDVIPILGWLDDIGILGLLIAMLLRRDKPEENIETDQPPANTKDADYKMAD